MSFTSRYLRCDDREIHFLEWGAEHRETVIAWHGLARTCRDMDDIAAHLSQRYRVICPDTLGRGLSQWAQDPAREYCLASYVRIATSLADQLGLQRLYWVGTSMGGAVGTLAAAGAGALRGRIARLVLNDYGPQLSPVALERIAAYAGTPPAFDTVGELEGYYRKVYQPFGCLSDAQWRRLAESSTRRLPDGRVTPHYDPRIAVQFAANPADYDLWPVWDSLRLPVLCLRGADSDLLLAETLQEMATRGPCATTVTIAGCGHAPALNTLEQLALVENFLAAEDLVAA
jgi:pimeloyl-ACP methyl ester carboxylesterase